MKILLIGKNGFIASSLYQIFKKQKYDIYNTSKEELNFLNKESVDNFMNNTKFDYLIFPPVYGGNRTSEDKNEIIKLNIKMYHNMLNHKDKFKLIFYFGSGACFDRNININNFNNSELGKSIPKDYYGYSKYYIENDIRKYNNIVNLRIFNCFGLNELSSRMIKHNIINYINNDNIIIHQDRFFDFFYIDDIFTIIINLMNTDLKNIIKKEFNCVYKKKLRLSDIANIINNLDDKKVIINILDKNLGKSYTGKYNLDFKCNFIGLSNGIKIMYKKLLNT
jgi:UDP-glucose 4-epimerase